MLRQFLIAATTVLALAACSDVMPTATQPDPDVPTGPLRTYTPQPGTFWNIFTTQTPASTLDASPGWEVGTRFYTVAPGYVTGFCFWRAEGETGSNTFNLWTNSGVQLVSRTATFTGSGWKCLQLNFGAIQRLQLNTYYRVSVSTNTAQVKTFGAFNNGPIINGPLTANQGYYGQPVGSMPNNASGSNFFVDVLFLED